MTGPLTAPLVDLTLNNVWRKGQHGTFRGFLGVFLSVYFLNLVFTGAELSFPSELSYLSPSVKNALSLNPKIPFDTLLLVLGSVLSIGLISGFRIRAITAVLMLLLLFSPFPLVQNIATTLLLFWLLTLNASLPQPSRDLPNLKSKVVQKSPALSKFHFWSAWTILAGVHAHIALSSISALLLTETDDATNALQTLLEHSPTPGIPAAVIGFSMSLTFVLLAVVKSMRSRFWILIMLLTFCKFLMEPSLSEAALLLAYFSVFDPNWFPGKGGPYRLFYDGNCGLCHKSVRFIIFEQSLPSKFLFSTLRSGHFDKIPSHIRSTIPDSLVLTKHEGSLDIKCRSDAVIAILEGIGGTWLFVGWLISHIPRVVRDGIYDVVAKQRANFFSRPIESCPIVPAWASNLFEDE